MNFERLPIELTKNILKKCRFHTIVKLMQTNSNINKFIRSKKLNKIDVDELRVCRLGDPNTYHMSLKGCPVLTDPGDSKKLFKTVKTTIDVSELFQVVNSIKSMNYMHLHELRIDNTMFRMLRVHANMLKTVSLGVSSCEYQVPKNDVLTLWKMFQNVINYSPKFNDPRDEILTEEMMLQTLPNVTFHMNYRKVATNLTNKTLEILANRRPPLILMRGYMTNYTAGEIIKLFTTIVQSRDPVVRNWIIGTVRMNHVALLEELRNQLNTDYSNVTCTPIQNGHVIKVEYKKQGTEETAYLLVEVIEPEVEGIQQ